MWCPDRLNGVEHPTHWYTVMAGNITVAGGYCAAEPDVSEYHAYVREYCVNTLVESGLPYSEAARLADESIAIGRSIRESRSGQAATNGNNETHTYSPESGEPECTQTRFPDGTHCGEYSWHARGCPMRAVVLAAFEDLVTEAEAAYSPESGEGESHLLTQGETPLSPSSSLGG